MSDDELEALGQRRAFAVEDDEVGQYLKSVREELRRVFYHDIVNQNEATTTHNRVSGDTDEGHDNKLNDTEIEDDKIDVEIPTIDGVNPFTNDGDEIPSTKLDGDEILITKLDGDQIPVSKLDNDSVSVLYECSRVLSAPFIAWKSTVLRELVRIKSDLAKSPLDYVECTLDPNSIPKWKKHVFDSAPPPMGFFFGLERPTVLKLLVYCTRWLSVLVNANLSQWIWCAILRIDNVLDANEASVMRDLGKKAVKLLARLNNASDIAKYTIDMVTVVVSEYYGQRDLMLELT